MLRATLLALAGAALHAGWNLVAKRSVDRFLALWGQFAAAGAIAAIVLAVGGGVPAAGWAWAAVGGAVHVPYLAGLARAYDHGDFSIVYPIARGSGALLAGVGGLALLDDRLNGWSIAAIVVVTGGICLLATGSNHAAGAVATALLVGATIGVYTTSDSHAARTIDGDLYPFAAFVAIAVCVSAYGIATGRTRDLVVSLRASGPQYAMTAVMGMVTYVLVLVAVRTAPVGYVAALRESSVLIAALLGARVLSEDDARRRTIAAAVIVAGLVLLVASA